MRDTVENDMTGFTELRPDYGVSQVGRNRFQPDGDYVYHDLWPI